MEITLEDVHALLNQLTEKVDKQGAKLEEILKILKTHNKQASQKVQELPIIETQPFGW